jgi:hypothetical protein
VLWRAAALEGAVSLGVTRVGNGMGNVELPYVREAVRSVIETFADAEFQERVWRRGEGHECVQDIDEDIMLLYDDSEVLPDPASAVGEVLYPGEVPALLRFGQLLRRVIDDLPHDAAEEEYLDHPAWRGVVQAAADVLAVWREGPQAAGTSDSAR